VLAISSSTNPDLRKKRPRWLRKPLALQPAERLRKPGSPEVEASLRVRGRWSLPRTIRQIGKKHALALQPSVVLLERGQRRPAGSSNQAHSFGALVMSEFRALVAASAVVEIRLADPDGLATSVADEVILAYVGVLDAMLLVDGSQTPELVWGEADGLHYHQCCLMCCIKLG